MEPVRTTPLRAALTALAALAAVLVPGPPAQAAPPPAPAAGAAECAVLAPHDYECVFMSVVKARVVVDPVERRLTTRAYLGHAVFGWRMVAERTWPPARGERDDLCGTAFGHTACVHAELSWEERFVSLRATYDGREVGSWRYGW